MWLPQPHSLTASASVGSNPTHRTAPQNSQPHSLPSLSHEGQKCAPLHLPAQGLWWPHCPRAMFSSFAPDLRVALNSALGSCAGLWLPGVGEKPPWIMCGHGSGLWGSLIFWGTEFSLGISSHSTAILSVAARQPLSRTLSQFVLTVNFSWMLLIIPILQMRKQAPGGGHLAGN